MKKSFTLIELLVTLVLGIIFFQFIFSFKLNFIEEISNIKKENELVKNMYHTSQMLSKGFRYENTTFPGIITLKVYNTKNRYRSHDGNTRIDFGFIDNSDDSLRYSKIQTSDKIFNITKFATPINSDTRYTGRLQVEKAKKYNNTNQQASAFYYTTFDGQDMTNEEIKYYQYTKLVYAK